MTESCANIYCQDGLQIYFATETQQFSAQIYGHYELQPNEVNGRPYFKFGTWGIWWDDISYWWLGYGQVGQAVGLAWNEKDVFCPHQLSGSSWWMYSDVDNGWYFDEGNDLGITCMCIIIQTKLSEFHTIPNILFMAFR